MYNYDTTGYEYVTSSVDSFGLAALWTFISTYMIFILIILVLNIIAMWKIFVKAGKPGWASLIPIYSQYVLLEIVGMKGWYVFLGFIPFVGGIILSIMMIIANYKLAGCFQKSSGFGVGLIFLSFIFYLILAFDSSVYTKPVAN